MHDITRRDWLASTIVSLAATASGTSAAVPGERQTGGTVHISPAVDAAWKLYYEKVERTRQAIYSSRFSGRPDVQRAANEYFLSLQAVAYTTFMAPRSAYPLFYVHSRYEPQIFGYGLLNPDFRYRGATVDGARTYRIWGRRGTTRFLDFQVDVAPDGRSGPKSEPKNYRLDNFQAGSDGRFEIIASADPHPGNWIALPGSAPHVAISVREALYDWEHETLTELHIEVQDDKPLPGPLLSEQEFLQRLEVVGDMVGYIAENWGMMLVDLTLRMAEGQRNRFGWQKLPSSAGTNPNANYANCIYDLADDEALLIEFDAPTGLYWGIQLGDVYLRSTDAIYHQSSLNGHQALRSADGKIRIVLSKQDPGVPNWLDSVDNQLGIIQFRQYFTDAVVPLPKTRVVDKRKIVDFLPADTPRISPEQRGKSLRSRRLAMLRHYGY